jgi:hypothetical protein
MNKIAYAFALTILLVCTAAAENLNQFVVELGAPIGKLDGKLLKQHGIKLAEAFSAGKDSYAVFNAKDKAALHAFLRTVLIEPEKILAVDFVNSPVIGGASKAAPEPRKGHLVFVIERPIPGVGGFALQKKQKISMASNAAISKMGNVIEWDHSYLTNEGTYCVYRADSQATIRKHGKLAKAPIGKITAVTQVKYE